MGDAVPSDTRDGIVRRGHDHLTWRWADAVERLLMAACGFCLLGFTSSTLLDVVTRSIGRPWLWLQEVTTAFFIYGVFIGAAVAVRRQDHLCLTALGDGLRGPVRTALEVFNRLVVLGVAGCLAVYGWQNFLDGFSSFRMPSMTPIAWLYLVIPVSGALMLLFTIEQLVNGLRHGFVPVET